MNIIGCILLTLYPGVCTIEKVPVKQLFTATINSDASKPDFRLMIGTSSTNSYLQNYFITILLAKQNETIFFTRMFPSHELGGHLVATKRSVERI
jgi:hypothetical protein